MSQHFEQPISLDDAYDVIDLTDDSEMTAFQQPDSLQYNTSNNELQFSTTLIYKHSGRMGE